MSNVNWTYAAHRHYDIAEALYNAREEEPELYQAYFFQQMEKAINLQWTYIDNMPHRIDRVAKATDLLFEIENVWRGEDRPVPMVTSAIAEVCLDFIKERTRYTFIVDWYNGLPERSGMEPMLGGNR